MTTIVKSKHEIPFDDLLQMVEILSPDPGRFLCSACNKLLTNPKQTSCGHLYCNLCLSKLFIQETMVCPLDGEVVHKNQVFTDNLTKRSVVELKVTCPFRRQGCSFVTELKSLQDHAKNCQHKPHICPQGCQQLVPLPFLEKHLKEDCQKAPVNCTYCKSVVPITEMKKHEDVCYQIPVSCPYGCELENLPRFQMNEHSQTCRFRPMACKYAYIGCIFQGSAEEVKEHEDDSSSHIELIFTQMLQRDFVITEMKDLLNEVQFENRILRSKVEQNSQMLEVVENGLERVSKSLLGLKGAFKDSLRLQRIERSGVDEPNNEVNLPLAPAGFQGVLDNLGRSVGKMEQQILMESVRIDTIREEIRERNPGCHDCDGRLGELDRRCQKLELTTYNGTFVWRVKDFWRYVQQQPSAEQGAAGAPQLQQLHSAPFYTSRYGYKLCLRMYPNGDGTSLGTHVSLFYLIMKSHNDEVLKWPFQHRVNIRLFDQVNGKDHIKLSFHPAPNAPSSQKPVKDTNVATGSLNFVSHETLRRKPIYVVNDTMYIEVVVKES